MAFLCHKWKLRVKTFFLSFMGQICHKEGISTKKSPTLFLTEIFSFVVLFMRNYTSFEWICLHNCCHLKTVRVTNLEIRGLIKYGGRFACKMAETWMLKKIKCINSTSTLLLSCIGLFFSLVGRSCFLSSY